VTLIANGEAPQLEQECEDRTFSVVGLLRARVWRCICQKWNRHVHADRNLRTAPDLSSDMISWLTLGQGLRDLVQKCLRKDPAERATAAELLQHPAFKVLCHLSAT
jgi:serine/threonine protein kinase